MLLKQKEKGDAGEAESMPNSESLRTQDRLIGSSIYRLMTGFGLYGPMIRWLESRSMDGPTARPSDAKSSERETGKVRGRKTGQGEILRCCSG